MLAAGKVKHAGGLQSPRVIPWTSQTSFAFLSSNLRFLHSLTLSSSLSLGAEATPLHTHRSSATLRRWETCCYISACFIKNNSRHYKVCVINMHMWYLRGSIAFKVSFQQDNIFPCEAGNSESYVWEGKARGLCTVLTPFVPHFPLPFAPSHPLY